MNDLDAITCRFIDLLEGMKLDYAVIGGLAVRLYALPRATFDADFTVVIPEERLSELNENAEKQGFAVPDTQRTGWLDRVRGYPVAKFQWWTGERPIDIDLFLVKSEFQQQTIARRQRHRIGDRDIWFVSPEDLILLKLLALRPKDRADIVDVLFIQPRLDEVYLKQWAAKLGVDQQLGELRKQVDL